MIGSFFSILQIPELRKKILITLGLIAVYRVGIYLPLPGIDYANIEKIGLAVAEQQGAASPLITLFNMFSGGSIQRVAVFALGIMPYISASIIFQLLTKIVPTLETLSKEGQAGRDKIAQYTRFMTLFLCLIQGYMILQTVVYQEWRLQNQAFYLVDPASQTFWFSLKCIITFTAGTMFLMWLGDQISDHGIGHGISLIIMLGIVSFMPTVIIQMYGQVDRGEIPLAKPLILFFCYVLVVGAVVLITQGQRKLPIQYAKHTRGRKVYGMSQRTHFPIRVNMAGVMPVIFASSLLIFPGIVLGAIGGAVPWVGRLGDLFGPTAWTYLTLYIAAVFFFSYFWNALMFNPVEQADRMKEIGAFIPGFTPGKKTAEFFEKVMNRMTLAGAAFLAAIAVLPNFASILMNVDMNMASILGGTGLLIVAGVALDVVTKIEAHLVMRNYEGFLKSGRTMRGRSR